MPTLQETLGARPERQRGRSSPGAPPFAQERKSGPIQHESRLTGAQPLLIARLTFEPLGSDLPAAGLVEITFPFLTRLELAFLTFPTAQ